MLQLIASCVCRLKDAGKQAERRIGKAEARATDLQHDLAQAQHQAQQVLLLTQTIADTLQNHQSRLPLSGYTNMHIRQHNDQQQVLQLTKTCCMPAVIAQSRAALDRQISSKQCHLQSQYPRYTVKF